MENKINVYFSANLVDTQIIKFLEKDFKVNVITIPQIEIKKPTPQTIDVLKTLDLIIYTGGEDVNPEIYGEQIGKYTSINKKRDDLECELLYNSAIPKSLFKNIPKLGICRG